MKSPNEEPIDISELIALLNKDRALILEKIDQGEWSDIRPDLAALERELGHFLTIAAEKLDSNS